MGELETAIWNVLDKIYDALFAKRCAWPGCKLAQRYEYRFCVGHRLAWGVDNAAWWRDYDAYGQKPNDIGPWAKRPRAKRATRRARI